MRVLESRGAIEAAAYVSAVQRPHFLRSHSPEILNNAVRNVSS